MWRSLSASQRFLLVCFLFSGITLAITFFLDGTVRTFAYSIAGLCFAAYVIVTSGERAKAKHD